MSKEMLLLLKLGGYFRVDETKHRKDVIDVVTLLFYADIDLQKVRGYIKKYGIDKRKGSDALLEYLDKGSTTSEFITNTKEEYEKLRKERRKEIRDIFGY